MAVAAGRDAELGSPGLLVLVVEDEFLVALNLERVLTRQGWRVLGPAATVAHALHLLEQGETPDAAVLEVNLRGEHVAGLRARQPGVRQRDHTAPET